jgi:hypothetical protein
VIARKDKQPVVALFSAGDHITFHNPEPRYGTRYVPLPDGRDPRVLVAMPSSIPIPLFVSFLLPEKGRKASRRLGNGDDWDSDRLLKPVAHSVHRAGAAPV